MVVTETEQRKLTAIQAMHKEIAPDGTAMQSPQNVAHRILSLIPVCRSEKWRSAVTDYAAFVLAESGENGEYLSWAYSQGSVYFASAVF